MTDGKDPAEAGLAIMRKMFGATLVDERQAAVTDFTRPLEDLVVRYCFGEVWSRQQLDPKTRSMLTLAVLTGRLGGVPPPVPARRWGWRTRGGRAGAAERWVLLVAGARAVVADVSTVGTDDLIEHADATAQHIAAAVSASIRCAPTWIIPRG